MPEHLDMGYTNVLCSTQLGYPYTTQRHPLPARCLPVPQFYKVCQAACQVNDMKRQYIIKPDSALLENTAFTQWQSIEYRMIQKVIQTSCQSGEQCRNICTLINTAAKNSFLNLRDAYQVLVGEQSLKNTNIVYNEQMMVC